MANPLRKLIDPRLPSAAIGLTRDDACVVSLERRRETFAVRSAGHAPLPEGLVHPSFDETNINEPAELAELLAELVTNVGLQRQRRWSVALPETATRTAIITLETTPASRGELEEMLRWKTERAVGATETELRVSRQRLSSDAEGRSRYLISAVRLAVLAEYEAVFASLGWHAGLILPHHMGEAWWLMRQGALGDALLVSAHHEGFIALLLRHGQPLLVRTAICEAEDCADELYRFILFYRDRMQGASAASEEALLPPGETIERVLITGHFDSELTSTTIEETLSQRPRTMRPEDLRLALASPQLDFNLLAAPAGLAALAWD